MYSTAALCVGSEEDKVQRRMARALYRHEPWICNQSTSRICHTEPTEFQRVQGTDLSPKMYATMCMREVTGKRMSREHSARRRHRCNWSRSSATSDPAYNLSAHSSTPSIPILCSSLSHESPVLIERRRAQSAVCKLWAEHRDGNREVVGSVMWILST